MELTQIKYFLDTAQTQHVTKSAENLHIAQPALTKSIHNLEEELNVPLFTKKGRNIVLTQYGQYLKEKLTPIVNCLDKLPEELAQMAKTENHTIRLCVSAASTIITQAIIEYKKSYPNINFHVLQRGENEIFDIEVTTNLFYNHNTKNQNLFVISEEIYLAVPDNEKYQNITSVDLSEMKNEGFISLFGSKHLRTICDKFCHHCGFEPNIIFESDSPQAVKNMIGANLGVGFWPEFTWGKINNKHVKLLKISSPICMRDILISCKNVKTDNTYVESFFEFLKVYLKRKKAHGTVK